VISAVATQAWEHWITVTRSRCHLHFEIEGGSLESHVASGRDASRRTADRVASDLSGPPGAILEVGCSVGFNCLALAERFTNARVVGIEPDGEACAVASAMATDFGITNVQFIQGVGECLPFPNESFDWIVCHTVIEHVNDVDACIAEMVRVLRPGGYLHIEAPNYLWPWEPHLCIVVPPLCPKPLMRLLARLQGAGAYVDYAEHLKLVHPAWIERRFLLHGLRWTNRVESKLLLAATGERSHIAAYGRLARILAILQSIGLARWVIGIILRTRIYSSILYTACKQSSDTSGVLG
jgi:SAM-dependent methyltransferase